MTNLVRSNFQDHPFHLVSPSPWPLYTSASLLALTTSTALSMHTFNNAYYIVYIGIFPLVINKYIIIIIIKNKNCFFVFRNYPGKKNVSF